MTYPDNPLAVWLFSLMYLCGMLIYQLSNYHITLTLNFI